MRAERRQHTDSTAGSASFESHLTSAAGGGGAVPAGSGTASASRQTLAAPTANRQNSGGATSPRLQDEPARTTGAGPAPSTSSTEEPAQTAATPSDSGIVVYNTPFGPMIKRPATASAATPSTTSTPAAASPTAGSAGTNAAANSAGTAAAPAVFTTGEAALEVLRKQFLSEGFDASGLNLSYAETQVYYPGGYFTNKLITLELGNGRKESYDVNLMLKNPWLTALEMRRFMAYST